MEDTSTASVKTSLLGRLSNLNSEPSQIGEADRSAELTAILTHAAKDQEPSYSLEEVARAVAISGGSSDLDALHVLPVLLDSEDAAADQILTLLAEGGNAKETVMAVQEAFERLLCELNSNEEVVSEKAFLRSRRLISVYTGAIPRLKLRKRSASETLRPLFADLVPVIASIASLLKKDESKLAVQLICTLLSRVIAWTAQQNNEDDQDIVKAQVRTILISLFSELSNSIETNMARQKFATCYPRLARNLSGDEHTKDEALLQECLQTAISSSYTVNVVLQERAAGSLFLLSLILSRTTATHPSPNSLLSAVFPILVMALQSNSWIDASLSVLLHALFPVNTRASTSIDPDFIAPLSTALASLASTSPDSTTRLIAFQILATLLARAPPLEHMTLLRELLTESPFPSMRVAAVGLLKKAVLESLPGPSPFASPEMFRTFGFAVLRPDPPDLFSKPASRESLQAFMETQESKRLVECLSFYYVLLMRDEQNVTGIRGPTQIMSVKKQFLEPLRQTMRAWEELEDIETIDEHAGMAFAALAMGLERIDEAHDKLDLKGF